MFRRILVYLDGSELAERILPYVIEQAKNFNSKVFLLAVNTPSSLMTFYSSMPGMCSGGMSVNWPITCEEPDTLSYLSDKALELTELGLNVETILLKGDVITIISKFIKDNAIDLVAIVSGAHRGWRRIFWGGNISESIIRECYIPTMVLNLSKTPESYF